jgi:hypothetical protein
MIPIKLLAAIASALLVLALLATPAEARRHHRYGWGYGYGWHSHYRRHRSSLARSEREGGSTSPAEKTAPAEVYGPPMPRLYIVRTIVNGSLPWSGPPPSWAGGLHVSPMLSSGRSASRP